MSTFDKNRDWLRDRLRNWDFHVDCFGFDDWLRLLWHDNCYFGLLYNYFGLLNSYLWNGNRLWNLLDRHWDGWWNRKWNLLDRYRNRPRYRHRNRHWATGGAKRCW